MLSITTTVKTISWAIAGAQLMHQTKASSGSSKMIIMLSPLCPSQITKNNSSSSSKCWKSASERKTSRLKRLGPRARQITSKVSGKPTRIIKAMTIWYTWKMIRIRSLTKLTQQLLPTLDKLPSSGGQSRLNRSLPSLSDHLNKGSKKHRKLSLSKQT